MDQRQRSFLVNLKIQVMAFKVVLLLWLVLMTATAFPTVEDSGLKITKFRLNQTLNDFCSFRIGHL